MLKFSERKTKRRSKFIGSGVAIGWHGWTMSRGPGAKRAPERETKKERKENEE